MLISFNWQTNYLIIPLLMAIMFDIRYIVTGKVSAKFNNEEKKGVAILNTMIMFLGQTTNGLLEFLRSNKRKSNKRIKSKLQYLWLFVAASLDLASFMFLTFIISESVGDLSLVLRMSQTFFIGLLMYPILKTKLYKHNILAIAIIVICLIIFILVEGLSMYLAVFYYLFSYFLNSLRIVVMKLLMEHYFYSTYKELLIIGIIGNVEILIGLVLEMFTNNNQYLKTIFTIIIPAIFSSPTSGICFVIMYLSGALFNTFGTLTNELLSSAHVGIGDTLAGLMFVVVKKGNTNEETRTDSALYLIMDVILNIIILIACFIFTEIIILHFWNLKRDTTNAITDRANEERANSLIFINNLDKDNDDDKQEEENEDPDRDTIV